MQNTTSIEQIVKTYILNQFLDGEDPSQLTPATPLISTGILDSLATLKVVSFLEEEFAISIRAHETSPEYLDSIARIAALVNAKRDEKPGGGKK